jgi:O-antigen ligase
MRFVAIAAILAAQVATALLITQSATIATVHALVTLTVGLWFACTSTLRRVAFVCAYIAGNEVLWRISKALLPWEFGKYAICLLILVSLGRTARLRWDWAAIGYFALLMPSTVIAFSESDFSFARQQVSFNLSGPFTLALATWFFGSWKLSRGDLQRVVIALLAPLAGLAAVTLTHAARAEDITFSDASNFQTSAGYGPNQVSTALGLGALLAILLVLLIDRGIRERLLFLGVAGLLAVESALTFSRGGLFSAFGALLIAAPFVMRGARNRVAVLCGAVILVLVLDVVVLPRLDALTSGALSTRFQDTDPTGRGELMRNELNTFAENPVFGVGPASLDELGVVSTSTHTEFTRLAAQHGIFGIGALLIMLLIAARDFARQPSAAAKAVCVALITWSLLTMGHAAMRLSIVPFVFGLAAGIFFLFGNENSQGAATSATAGAAIDAGASA